MVGVVLMAKEKADELYGQRVVNGQVNQGTGHLILTRGNGSQFDAGAVKPDAYVYPDYPALYTRWPVGSIYISANNVSPALSLGGGTWERFGVGRTIVSVDDSDAELNGALKVGGSKVHTITIAEMPFHNHGGATTGRSADHAHYYTADGINSTDLAGGNGLVVHTGFTTSYTAGASTDHAHGIQAQGDGQPHNNLMPYQVVYMWRRTG
jgi:microcystin-dependent protein